MGRKGWPKPNQLEWLEGNVCKYREAQSQKKLTEFYPQVMAAFLQLFPFVTSDPDDVDKEDGVEYMVAPTLKVARTVCDLFLVLSIS